MRLQQMLIVFLAALAFWPAPSGARDLFNEDFQNRQLDGWSANPGRGDITLTTYQGNVSLRLTRDASIVRRVATDGASAVEIRGAFAALDLEGEDACVIEASEDGVMWVEIGRIGDGADDGVTLHPVVGTVELKSQRASMFLGVRIAGNADNDTCWIDNISVKTHRDISALEKRIPKDAFSGTDKLTAPISTKAFRPPQTMEPLTEDWSGRLVFAGTASDGFNLYKDDFNYAPSSRTLSVLPAFSIDFVHSGNDFIPVQRGPQPAAHAEWEWVFEPGVIWRDRQYDGALRVALPFALQERNANCVHNGLISFLIDKTGAASRMVYQIGSETCAYMQFDLWGAAPVDFERRAYSGADAVVDLYEKEKASRLALSSPEALPQADQFASPAEVAPADLAVFGYVDGAVHYAGGCVTRFGPYPFCDVLDLPSYSLAKSIVAGIAAMRLEKLYPGAMASMVMDYAPECTSEKWRGVTFSHALNMTTGVFDSSEHEADESGGKMLAFFLAQTHDEKIETACNAFSRQRAPGELFVYRTSDTYVLGTAMNAFLRQQTGRASADIFDNLVAPIWASLGVSQTALHTRRTYDDVRQPFAGWGVTLHRNDIALITNFLQNGGVIDGEPVLDTAMLKAAMQQAPADRGLRAAADSQRYKNGFWAWNAGPAIGCAGDRWIPAMSGYGGLAVALFPNRASYYYVSDGGAYAWRRAAAASNRMKPFCEVPE